MDIIGISINHKTASVEKREVLHLSVPETIDFIQLLKKELVDEGLIISTCNRTEIFGIAKDEKSNYKHIVDLLTAFKKKSAIESGDYVPYFSCSAVKHLFKVAAGIDSQIIGDSQILGQVREAFQLSDDLNFSGALMHKLKDFTMRVGKRSVTETRIGEGAVTVSFAAVKVIEKIFADFHSKKALIIGAGETGELAAVHLKDKEIGELFIANRTKERADALAEKLSGKVLDFEKIQERLHEFDIVISATSSEDFILSFDDVKSASSKRKRSPMVIMDIAVPRDVDPKAKKLDGIFYNDIDSLNIIVEQNLKKREREIPLIENIIMEEMIGFFRWYNTLDIVPTIKEFRDFFEEIRRDEFEKVKHKLHDHEMEKIENMTKRLIGRVLHNPTMKLKNLSEKGTNYEQVKHYSAILRELFLPNNKNDEFKEE
ncbi:MAG: glutamyl-tRNA reductase [Chlorobi bacterium]|nr:glutamyl-tRNA reductase [Chlorobiota bacterium]